MSNIGLIVLAIVRTPNSIVKLNPSTSFEQCLGWKILVVTGLTT